MTDAQGRGGIRRVVREPALRRLLGAFAVSKFGDLLYNTAIVAVVLQRTGSASWVAATIVAQVTPHAVLTPFAGVLADRMDRRRLMVVTDLGRALVMVAATLIVAFSAPVAALLAIGFVSSCVGAPFFSAFIALMPEVVDEDKLASANALISSIMFGSIVIGPAVAALALLSGLEPLPFAVNAGTFLVSAALVSGTRRRGTTAARGDGPGGDVVSGDPASHVADDDAAATGTPSPESFGAALATGFRVIWRVPLVRSAMLLSAVIMLVYGVQQVLLPLISRDVLNTGEAGLGWLNAAIGAGGVAATTLAARLCRGDRLGTVLALSTAVFALPLAVLGVSGNRVVAYAILAVQGAAALVQEVAATTAVQRGAPADQIARVDGLLASVVFAAGLVGNLAAAPLLDLLGIDRLLVLTAVVGTVASLAALADRAARRPTSASPLVPVLRRLGPLEGLDQRGLEALAAAAGPAETVPAGTRLLDAGERADHVLVLVDGACDVLASARAGVRLEQERLVNQVEGPDLLGEIGVLRGLPRTASVVTTGPCTVHRIAGTAFAAALGAGPAGAGTAIESVVANRLARWPG